VTERLWLTQPRRATAIAKVVAVEGGLFALDRSLFAPTSRLCRHPQPHDMGMVWIDGGEKRKLVRVLDRGGRLWHQLRGTVPPVGATLNCQLDQERREKESRAHTAMHLLLVALQRAGAGPLVADPTVKGGGTFRLDFAQAPAPKLLAAALAQANQWVQDNRPVRVEHVLRGMETKVLDAQQFEVPDPYPGPDGSVPAARVEGVCCLPCDGTHVERTLKVGRVVVAQAHRGAGGFVVVGRVGG
jgi:Ser-tRNA(Ala) deacylase AlaX